MKDKKGKERKEDEWEEGRWAVGRCQRREAGNPAPTLGWNRYFLWVDCILLVKSVAVV